MEIVRTLTMEEKGLDDTPEFYASIPNSPSIGRLRGFDTRVRLPYIVEFIEGVAYATIMNEKFATKFSRKPLVTGLIETRSSGQKVCKPLVPDDFRLTIRTDGITIGSVNFPLVIGDKYKLKVYSLDYLN